jgi:hypothetical protein
MACGPCEQRRRMIAEAAKQGGVKGVVKVLPKVAMDAVKYPPKYRKKPNG